MTFSSNLKTNDGLHPCYSYDRTSVTKLHLLIIKTVTFILR